MTMKALVLETGGSEPDMAVKDVQIPELSSHDVLIEVAACGLCYHDIAVMQGTLRRGVKPDVILGHEISGRVAEVGNSVASVKAGDRIVTTLTTFCGKCENCLSGREYRCVYGQGIGHAIDGGFAQFVKLPENSLIVLPDDIDLENAAIFGCPMGVALQAIRDVAKLQVGETALVTGAGGGLGVHAIQIASALGARVLAVTTSPEKLEALEQLASGEVILADELDFSEIALALTEDQGVDVVVNNVGSAVFRSSLNSMTQFGRMVLLGEITGERVSLNLAEVLFRDATIVGSTGAGPRHINDVIGMVGDKLIKPVVSHKFSLHEAATAYRSMRDKKTFGRVVLLPQG